MALSTLGCSNSVIDGQVGNGVNHFLVDAHDGFLSHNLTPSSRRVIATTAVGQNYLENWSKYSAPSWLRYCEFYDVGLVVITDNLDGDSDTQSKNGSWQKMLAPSFVIDNFPAVEIVCLLDSDVVISPIAKNVFDHASSSQYSVVSEVQTLPFELMDARKRVAFYRRRFYDPTFPSESILMATPQDEFKMQGVKGFDNYFCAGLLCVPSPRSAELASWYHSAPAERHRDIAFEQVYLNSWVQSTEPEWLPYEFQAIWNYEMAVNYPHLYRCGSEVSEAAEAVSAIENLLLRTSFVHFAGSWFESRAWQAAELAAEGAIELAIDLKKFLNTPHRAVDLGKFMPSGQATEIIHGQPIAPEAGLDDR